MTRFPFAAGLALVLGAAAAAQPPAGEAPLRFKWQAGQALVYKIAQQTAVTETTVDEKTDKPVTTETRTTLNLTRRWLVKAVDATGAATLDMQITEVKNTIKQADGSTVVRDSTVPEQAKEMADYLHKTVLTVRVDAQGRLVEVKEAAPGAAARLQAELPFRIVLPAAGPTTGQVWDRAFTLKLDPPLGTGEGVDFIQKYTCKGEKDGLLAIGVETALKAPPRTTGEQVPLVPMLWSGDLYFHPAGGRYHAARLTARAELVNHAGEGSKFVYLSTYTEDAAAAP